MTVEEQEQTADEQVWADDVLTPYARDLANESGVVTFDAERRRELAALAHRDGLVNILKSRRFDLLPPSGDGAPFTTAQGRESGDATTPTELSDLIASIETMGVLQPILVEESTSESGEVMRHVVAGERRLRAVRWGNTHRPDNPHFQQIPAIIVPGPLTDEDKRSWQLIENLAREDLKPGELAAALLFERCAILVTKLLSHSIAVPRDILALDDPVERFERLEKLRGTNPSAAAPWEEVIHRLGLQLTPRKARQLVAAFKSLPPHVSEEMDDQKIALTTRIKFVELRKGREDAADEIWAAIRATQNAKSLLTAAVGVAEANPDLDVAEVVTRAEESVLAANQSRREALVHDPTLYGAPPAGQSWADMADHEEAESLLDSDAQPDLSAEADGDSDGNSPLEPGLAPGQTLDTVVPNMPDPADPTIVKNAMDALRVLVTHLNDGHAPAKYDAGSLRIQARRLLDALDNPTPGQGTQPSASD